MNGRVAKGASRGEKVLNEDESRKKKKGMEMTGAEEQGGEKSHEGCLFIKDHESKRGFSQKKKN